jgi:pyruvate dehydrogenase E1 component alpha subunit/2-oxoisovalerate dehydrogenase E1 component
MSRSIEKEIDEAVAFAETGTWEPVEELTRFVYSEKKEKPGADDLS